MYNSIIQEDNNGIMIIQQISEEHYSWQKLLFSIVDWGRSFSLIDNSGYKLERCDIKPSNRPSKVLTPDAMVNTSYGKTIAVKKKSSIFTFYEMLNGKYYKLCSIAA